MFIIFSRWCSVKSPHPVKSTCDFWIWVYVLNYFDLLQFVYRIHLPKTTDFHSPPEVVFIGGRHCGTWLFLLCEASGGFLQQLQQLSGNVTFDSDLSVIWFHRNLWQQKAKGWECIFHGCPEVAHRARMSSTETFAHPSQRQEITKDMGRRGKAWQGHFVHGELNVDCLMLPIQMFVFQQVPVDCIFSKHQFPLHSFHLLKKLDAGDPESPK